ncbi:hypothetical protein [Microvirga flavescens]|uniref:DUF4376 domain-containing protein n=1 Tax=Microvirga flavescens TaxID=2249811 RepID=UPI000DD5FB26|nr:hypothetical protein [Microvirga flavescens]
MPERIDLSAFPNVKFKVATGFVDLGKDAITALAMAVASHVQACFAKEAGVLAAIDSDGS